MPESKPEQPKGFSPIPKPGLKNNLPPPVRPNPFDLEPKRSPHYPDPEQGRKDQEKIDDSAGKQRLWDEEDPRRRSPSIRQRDEEDTRRAGEKVLKLYDSTKTRPG